MKPSHDTTAKQAMRKCWMLTGMAIAFTGLGLASCAPQQAVAPAPAPVRPAAPVAPPPPATVASNWQDGALTPGDWFYRADPAATRALFGTAGGATLFTMACEPANRQIRLWRAGATGKAAAMTIVTTSQSRTLPALVVDGSTPQTMATLPPHDPIIDAMVFSRGRFAVMVPGAPDLLLPNWAEIARVAEDCR
ncbi:hypothetical protein RM533_02200 [Croceicoccus sp. F390]|uniref:Uncharacterized protein n=1 Tax=Croceicoccus esteveae TaxID=3075597 RepID=A0ABU2ZEG7_9SPHN|nr:hypothetical protein [Croceicoccus sp. F390]MDT0574992.1 hypothetical protein [Croceicoccus sp. F390]